MPETKVTTAMTAAIPITTPSSVSTERSLLAHNERNAIRMASATFISGGGRRASGVTRRASAVRIESVTVYSEFGGIAQGREFAGRHPELGVGRRPSGTRHSHPEWSRFSGGTKDLPYQLLWRRRSLGPLVKARAVGMTEHRKRRSRVYHSRSEGRGPRADA